MKKASLESRLLVLVTLGLVAFGLVMVYSATSAPAALASTDPMSYLKKQTAYAVIGFVGMMLAARFDYRRLRYVAPSLVLSALLLCLAVLVIGTRVNGARRWISFGPATFQPSELAKLALAIWAASYLARRPAPRTLKDLARPIGLLLFLFCLLVLAEPDLGTAITIVIVLAAILLISGTPAATLAVGGGILASLGLLAIWIEPYRRARIFSFIDPWKDAQGAGFQTVQALIAMGSGGLFGVGIGQGVTKINYLPEAHTDMIMAVIGEELGLFGVTAVIVAFATFAYAGLRVALACKDPFGKRLAAGLVALVAGQAVVNLAAVLGLAPLTGIPLPFISYGGSSLVVALLSVGILLNIAGGHGAEARAAVPDRGGRDSRSRAPVARGRGSARSARRSSDVRRVAGSRRGSARP
ncbi:MAG TPA: putative lipid II flippase FtsW [Gaiellaceae bacterium]|nr:putative lipid II flippase FtsW [Gaiellaceae bacterium]